MHLAHPVPQDVGAVHGLSLCVCRFGEQAPISQGVGAPGEAVFHHVPGAPCRHGAVSLQPEADGLPHGTHRGKRPCTILRRNLILGLRLRLKLSLSLWLKLRLGPFKLHLY